MRTGLIGAPPPGPPALMFIAALKLDIALRDFVRPCLFVGGVGERADCWDARRSMST